VRSADKAEAEAEVAIFVYLICDHKENMHDNGYTGENINDRRTQDIAKVSYAIPV
jgi:hypothetical protein